MKLNHPRNKMKHRCAGRETIRKSYGRLGNTKKNCLSEKKLYCQSCHFHMGKRCVETLLFTWV